MSHPLDLEFVDQPFWSVQPWSWLGLIIFALSLIFSIFVGYQYQTKQEILVTLNDHISKLKQQESKKDIAQLRPEKPLTNNAIEQINPEQIKQTKQIVTELTFPWQRIFTEIEKSDKSDIALLSVDPDIKKAHIALAGEAKDLAAALSYVQTLEAQDMLTQVYLQKHSIDESAVGKPVKFVIVANLNLQSLLQGQGAQ